MKILVISAFFPPYHSGGYEIRVKNILDELVMRGHKIFVLTTILDKRQHSKAQPPNYPVVRKLHNRLDSTFFPKEILFDLLDTRLLEETIDCLKPDVLYLGHTYVLSKALLPFLATRKIPIVYDEGGSGLIDAWTEHGRWFRFTGDFKSRFEILNNIRPAVVKLVCAFSKGRIKTEWTWPSKMNIVFNSELNSTNASAKGVLIDRSKVIHSGIDTLLFTFKPRTRLNTPLKIIVPGRIERRKGQLDAVHMLKGLIDVEIDARIILVGSISDEGYFDEIVDEIKNSHLTEYCTILPMLPQDDLVKLYQDTDICFFTSYQKIGFSRTPLEAMACGCIVISYGNEGSDEVIKDQQTGFLVKPRDFTVINRLIKRIILNPDYVNEITIIARKETEGNCSLQNYIDRVEGVLLSMF